MDRHDPSQHVAVSHPCEARLRNGIRKLLLLGKSPDAFHEIPVGCTIAGHQLAHGGNGGE